MNFFIHIQWHSIARHWEVRQNGHMIYTGSRGGALDFAQQRIDLLEEKGEQVDIHFDMRGGE